MAGQTQQGNQAQPQLFKADVELLLAGDQLLQEEIFRYQPQSSLKLKIKPNSFKLYKA
ncbi:hypothetical protein AB3515_09055 [Acinetobacter baumannii]